MKTKLILSIFSVIFSSIIIAQDRKIAKADSYFSMSRFYDASLIYNELMFKNKIDAATYPDVFRHGAESNIRSKQYTQAKEAYDYLGVTDQFNFDDAYSFIKLLLYMDRIEDAKEIYAKQVVTSATDQRKIELANYFETEFLTKMKSDSLGASVTLAPFNSNLGDFSPAFHPKGIAFTSARDKSMQTPWLIENTAFLSQYLYDKTTEKVSRIKGIKGKKHDGVAYYDSVNKLYYYTKNLKRNKKLNLTGGFQTFVLPISRQWFVKWKDSDAIFKNIFYDNTEYTTPNKSQYKFSDILNALSGTGATNVPVSEEQEHFLIKHVLKTLIVSFKNRTDSLAITKTSEAIWLKSLDENSIDNIPNFISIWSDTWNDTKGSSINLSYILSDHSIGYINSISGLSCLIHEINTFHDVSNPLDSTKYSGKALFYDTHGADEFLLEFSTIQQHLQNNNSALGYFNNFQSVNPQNHNGPWLALFTNPHNAILYLNYYSTKILQL
jgi:hypothetical protein